MIKQQASVNGNREYWVDGVKGLACLVVFLHHFILAFGTQIYGLGALAEWKVTGFIVNGNWAVCLFLIISSYVIGKQFLIMDTLEDRRIMGTMIKRYFRLFFPVFTASLFACILWNVGAMANLEVAQLENNVMLGTFYTEPLTIGKLLKTTLIEVWWSGNSLFNGPFWMMGYLLKGTFLTILIALVLRKNKYGWMVLAALFALYFYQQSYYVCTVLGALWAYLSTQTGLLVPEKNPILQVLYGGIGILAMAALGYVPRITGFVVNHLTENSFLGNYVFWNAMSAFAVLMVLAKLGGIAQAMGNSKVLRFISRNSFAVFLFHWPIVCSVTSLAYMQLYRSIADPYLLKTLLLVLTTVLTFVVAMLYTKFFENGIFDKWTKGLAGLYLRGYCDESNK